MENHVLDKRLFKYFDKNGEGVVEFCDFIQSLNIIEKGNFQQKVALCFNVYDFETKGHLEPSKITELLKIAYINPITQLEKCIMKIQYIGGLNDKYISWTDLIDPKNEVITNLRACLPVMLGIL